MVIIQGSNTPITITFSDNTENFTDLHIMLTTETYVLKHWTFDDIVREDIYTISCPLTQEETVAFEEGGAILEVKWMEDDIVQFAKQVQVKIVHRYDHHIIGDEDENN